jgi:hypothetical protein
MKTFRDELNEGVKYLLDHKQLKSTMVKMYKKYVHEETTIKSNAADFQKECNRQREVFQTIYACMHYLFKGIHLANVTYVIVLGEECGVVEKKIRKR